MKAIETELKFKITVTRISTRTFETTEATLKEERHYTDVEIQENHRYINERESEKYTKKLYGERPTIGSNNVSEEVFEQTVKADGFDITEVIKAVNGLNKP